MRRWFPLLITGMLGLAACSTSSSDVPSTSAALPESTVPDTALAGFTIDTLQWTSCGDQLECTTLRAPLDYDDLSGPTVTLALTRHPAREPGKRIGSLLVNPGGPGLGARFLVKAAGVLFTDALVDRFDIVGVDPRGTGDSTPALDCIDDYDPYFAVDFPDTPEGDQRGIALVKQLSEQCAARSGELLAHVSTQDAARDLDLVRRALGELVLRFLLRVRVGRCLGHAVSRHRSSSRLRWRYRPLCLSDPELD